ncbi:MAG TPA: heme-binding protein [Thioalkalivibrio sp.]|nr:heme-binding protein [Thioalkalivibrio sp.]
MGKLKWAPLAAACMVWSAALAASPVVTTQSLSLDTANRMAVAAAGACAEMDYTVGVAVVDRGGNLQAFVRDPLAGPHTIDVAIQKAYAATSFQTPTLAMGDMPTLNHAPRVLLVGGGVPVEVGGIHFGGIGVSGAPRRKVAGDVDDECARAGIEAVRTDIEFAQ